MKPSILGIIPVRLNSTRLPRKALSDIGGKTMIQRVWEQVRSSIIPEIIIATDSEEIIEHCKTFNGRVVLTSSHHQTGTDRCMEVARRFPHDFYINIQGDEPFIPVQLLDDLVEWIQSFKNELQVGTVSTTLCDKKDWKDSNVVKVVCAKNTALYFSRSPLPYFREGYKPGLVQKHLGIYVYSKEVLMTYTLLRDSILEKAEKLEQLRWLENGIPIHVLKTDYESLGIDTPEDLLAARQKVITND